MTGITHLTDRDRQLWGHQPLRAAHRLHEHPLFQRAALCRLIETYPRDHYGLIAMGGTGEDRAWREGDLGGVSGETALDAIARGKLWLNLRNVSGVDVRHGALLNEIMADLAAQLPGFDACKWQSGILISSPSAQVYYHADLPHQLLYQIAGKKRLHIYPATPPFITARQLEDIALFDVEVDIPYHDWYDGHARVLDLTPGHMLGWPLNAPHRVENVEGVNISLTISCTTPASRRGEMVHFANGLLRHRFGWTPRSTRLEGAGFYAKAVLQKLMRRTGWVKQQRARRRVIAFTLADEHLHQAAE